MIEVSIKFKMAGYFLLVSPSPMRWDLYSTPFSPSQGAGIFILLLSPPPMRLGYFFYSFLPLPRVSGIFSSLRFSSSHALAAFHDIRLLLISAFYAFLYAFFSTLIKWVVLVKLFVKLIQFCNGIYWTKSNVQAMRHWTKFSNFSCWSEVRIQPQMGIGYVS